MKKCEWCLGKQIYENYHDTEWGVPEYNDQKLFEMLCLEGAQAGLSWITVLQKREHYRQVFDEFDPQKIARYTDKKREQLLSDPGIIRNKLKVNAFIVNAQTYLDIQESGRSFSEYIWEFIDGTPKINRFKSMSEVPANTRESDIMAKHLKKDGFKFVGSTIIYAFMQASGMVNDHTTSCFRHKELS